MENGITEYLLYFCIAAPAAVAVFLPVRTLNVKQRDKLDVRMPCGLNDKCEHAK